MGPSIQNVSKPRYAIRIAHAFTCSLMKSYSHFRCPVQWFGAHRTWGPRFIRLHPTTGYVAPRMTVVFHTVDCTDSVTVQTAHSFAHPAEHADTGSDPVKTFVLATWMYRYGQAVRIGYRQVHLRTTHLFGVSGRSWRQSIKTSLRSAYVRAYGDHDLRNMSSLFIRDPSAMGFAQGEYVFRASSRTAADKREANMRSSMRRLPIPVGGSRSAFNSGCNITTARPNADRPFGAGAPGT